MHCASCCTDVKTHFILHANFSPSLGFLVTAHPFGLVVHPNASQIKIELEKTLAFWLCVLFDVKGLKPSTQINIVFISIPT